jgi:hypothetical protein
LRDNHVARRRERILITSSDRQKCALRGERKCRTSPDIGARAGDEAVSTSESEVHDIVLCAMLDAQPALQPYGREAMSETGPGPEMDFRDPVPRRFGWGDQRMFNTET